MVYCAQDNRLYAAASSDAKDGYANSVCRIDPSTGKIEASVFVGDDPHGIVKSPDGSTLYVMVAGDTMVRAVDRASLKAGANFPIGDNQKARGLAVIPDAPDALIVRRYDPHVSPPGDNLAVFRGGQCTVQNIPCFQEFFLGVDPARVYTISSGSSSMFYFGVNALLHTENGPSGFNGGNKSCKTSGYGLGLTTDGSVIDLEAKQFLGQLKVESGELCVDPYRPLVYEIGNDSKPRVRCWDLRTYQMAWEADLPTWDGPHHPSAPLRYGRDGFAYLDGDFIVCGPWNLGKPFPLVDLSVSRSGVPKDPLDGKTFTYTLTVTNNSNSPSTGAVLTDTIPGTTSILEMTPSQGTATFAHGTIVADLGSIKAHNSATLRVKINVQTRGAGGYCAVVRSFDPDPDTSNNVYPGTTFVPHAALSLGNPTGSLNGAWDTLSRNVSGTGDDLSLQIVGKVTIVNNGKKTSNPCVVRFYLQDGPNLVVDWAYFLQETGVPALDPGQSYTVSLSAPVTAITDVAGMFVVANVDPLKENGSTVNLSSQIH